MKVMLPGGALVNGVEEREFNVFFVNKIAICFDMVRYCYLMDCIINA